MYEVIVEHVVPWLEGLASEHYDAVMARIEMLEEAGPTLGRPTVDVIKGSRHSNMKELRTGSLRVLFAFDPERRAVMLVGGDKRKQWEAWYRDAIPKADKIFDAHLSALREGRERDEARQRRRDAPAAPTQP